MKFNAYVFFFALSVQYSYGQRIINKYLYKFPINYKVQRVGIIKGATNIYRLSCSDYITIYPNVSDTIENNRLPHFSSAFFTPSRSEIFTTDSLLVHNIFQVIPNYDSAKWLLKEIRMSDRYYMGYVNKNGYRKILVIFDLITIYDGPIPPSVFDYIIP